MPCRGVRQHGSDRRRAARHVMEARAQSKHQSVRPAVRMHYCAVAAVRTHERQAAAGPAARPAALPADPPPAPPSMCGGSTNRSSSLTCSTAGQGRQGLREGPRQLRTSAQRRCCCCPPPCACLIAVTWPRVRDPTLPAASAPIAPHYRPARPQPAIRPPPPPTPPPPPPPPPHPTHPPPLLAHLPRAGHPPLAQPVLRDDLRPLLVQGPQVDGAQLAVDRPQVAARQQREHAQRQRAPRRLCAHPGRGAATMNEDVLQGHAEAARSKADTARLLRRRVMREALDTGPWKPAAALRCTAAPLPRTHHPPVLRQR